MRLAVSLPNPVIEISCQGFSWATVYTTDIGYEHSPFLYQNVIILAIIFACFASFMFHIPPSSQ